MTWNLAGSSPVPYKVNQSGGVVKRSVLVEDSTNPYQCKGAAGANAGEIIGIARETVADGDHVPVQQYGEAECIASAAIGVGDRVNISGATASGLTKVKTVSEGAGVIVYGVGRALTAATADGDIISVALQLDRSTAS